MHVIAPTIRCTTVLPPSLTHTVVVRGVHTVTGGMQHVLALTIFGNMSLLDLQPKKQARAATASKYAGRSVKRRLRIPDLTFMMATPTSIKAEPYNKI